MGIGFGAVVSPDCAVQLHRNVCISDGCVVKNIPPTDVGELCVIQQGQPKGDRINHNLIYELPDRQIPVWRSNLFEGEFSCALIRIFCR